MGNISTNYGPIEEGDLQNPLEPNAPNQNNNNNNNTAQTITHAQAQALMRRGLDPDLGLVPFQMPRISMLPELAPAKDRDTVTVKTNAHVQKGSVVLDRTAENSDQYRLQLVVDCEVRTTLQVFVCVTEITNAHGYTVKWDSLAETGQRTAAESKSGLNNNNNNNEGSVLTRTVEVAQSGGVIVLENLLSAAQVAEALKHAQNPGFYGVVIVLSSNSTLGQKTDVKTNASKGDPAVNTGAFNVTKETTCFKLQQSTHTGQVSLKVDIQKLVINGNTYTMREIYGLDAKGGKELNAEQEEEECVICLTEPRDTSLIPCRHMCLCASCASMLRKQDNRCPICRQYVESLLTLPTATVAYIPEEDGAQATAF